MADHSHTMVYDTTNFIKARWTRTSQLQLLVEQTKPVGNPGEKFSYSDTGYVLLGEILEKVTGLTMGEAIDQLLDFEKLGLHSTIMEAVDGDFSGKRIHQYYRGRTPIIFIPPSTIMAVVDCYRTPAIFAGFIGSFSMARFFGRLLPSTPCALHNVMKKQRSWITAWAFGK